jgi:hypothetical protein
MGDDASVEIKESARSFSGQNSGAFERPRATRNTALKRLAGAFQMTTEQQNYLQEHLPYMLKMLRYTYNQMQQQQHYLSWNAHFESFAVHARNLANFLSNNDTGNFRAVDFVHGYKARKGDLSGPLALLEKQVFHLSKQRPIAVVDKFNTDKAKAVFAWIEQAMTDFLSKLGTHERRLFGDSNSQPESAQALMIALGPMNSYGIPSACTATPIIVGSKVGS